MSSDDNHNKNDVSSSFFTTLKESFAPHDQRRGLSRGNVKDQQHLQQQQYQHSYTSAREPLSQRTTSDTSSTTTNADITTTGTTITAAAATEPPTEAHRDATDVGSHFLEDLTPGRQRRRRSSVLEALGNTIGSGTARQRRSSGAGNGGLVKAEPSHWQQRQQQQQQQGDAGKGY